MFGDKTETKNSRSSFERLRRSSFFDEFISALGTGDADLAAAAWHADALAALGTTEIAVLLILEVGNKGGKDAIFPAPGCDVSGVYPKDTPDQQAPTEDTEQRGPDKVFDEHAQEHKAKAHCKDRSAQPILSISPDHEIAERIADLSKHNATLLGLLLTL